MQEVIFLRRITKVGSDLGISIDFVQDNQISQKKGRYGLHYQNPPFAQTKLVRVLQKS
jgi:dTDP-4-dehydrorhamnose 3,5-epimerase